MPNKNSPSQHSTAQLEAAHAFGIVDSAKRLIECTNTVDRCCEAGSETADYNRAVDALDVLRGLMARKAGF